MPFANFNTQTWWFNCWTRQTRRQRFSSVLKLTLGPWWGFSWELESLWVVRLCHWVKFGSIFSSQELAIWTFCWGNETTYSHLDKLSPEDARWPSVNCGAHWSGFWPRAHRFDSCHLRSFSRTTWQRAIPKNSPCQKENGGQNLMLYRPSFLTLNLVLWNITRLFVIEFVCWWVNPDVLRGSIGLARWQKTCNRDCWYSIHLLGSFLSHYDTFESK